MRFVPLPAELRALAAEQSRRPMPAILESAAPSRGGEVSLLAARPAAALVTKGHRLLEYHAGAWREATGDPLEAVGRWLAAAPRGTDDRGAPRWVVAGCLGYDLARRIERLPELAVDDQPMPEVWLARYESALLFDHRRGRSVAIGEPGSPGMHSEAEADAFLPPAAGRPPPARSFTRAGYLEAVEQVREAIRCGEVYEVNLSQRFAVPWQGDPWTLYEHLRARSPAPFAAFLRLGRRTVVSSSPEEFLRVDGRDAITRPIKGTRPRARDRDADRAAARELLSSPKDDAELVMILDLMRNDLGRVAVPGTVRVLRRRGLERHPTVWHLFGTVAARLRPGVGLEALLRAAFPAGSITGAPRIRAMELIEGLEPQRRGVFSGAIVMLTSCGRLRSSVAIRTMQLCGTVATFQAGGAVVWDSEPEAEYRETLVKAGAMAQAAGVRIE